MTECPSEIPQHETQLRVPKKSVLGKNPLNQPTFPENYPYQSYTDSDGKEILVTGIIAIDAANQPNPKLEVDRYPIFFIVADLDGLKIINDQYGHDAGDKYILSFVKFTKEVLRPDDDGYRTGGDEFLATVKNINTDQKLSSQILRLRILEKLQKFNEDNYYSKEPKDRTIDHPLEFTFGIESSKLELVGQTLNEDQRLKEINRAIKAADKKEIKLKKKKKAQQVKQHSQL